MELISHCLSPEIRVLGIRSLIGFGNLVRPLAHSVLYLLDLLLKAIPKYVLRRTSYFPV